MIQKCNLNFQSQYAFIKNKSIHITEYKVGDYIKCKNGHQLVFCNGVKNKAHFRHKNKEDVNICPKYSLKYML